MTTKTGDQAQNQAKYLITLNTKATKPTEISTSSTLK
uniref:Uncharacterized protein n=1 Tax=Rhizophora mucronata TaxID=61149 RepID=A0A2P2PI83_RHIMU